MRATELNINIQSSSHDPRLLHGNRSGNMSITRNTVLIFCTFNLLSAQAQLTDQTSTVEIRAKNENLMGTAISGNEGIVSGVRIASLPILRPGEVMEMVPGLIVTQHAGDGKANQYFLRGFNLDHGTDFSTYVNAFHYTQVTPISPTP